MARVVLTQNQLAKLLDSPQGAVARDITMRAQRVLNRARSLCPVDTGNLRGSLTYEIARDGTDITARVGTNVPYAVHVEMGTKHMAAQPFLRPALDAAR